MKATIMSIMLGIVLMAMVGCTQTKAVLEGTAKLPAIQACTDSDSGLSYYAKGEVRDGNDAYTDRCTAEGNIIEYYCDTIGNVAFKNTACPQGTCFEGACK